MYFNIMKGKLNVSARNETTYHMVGDSQVTKSLTMSL